MDEVYKGNKIRASTWQLADAGHWEPRVFVTWREGEQEKTTKSLVFTRSFSTEREAESEGLQWLKNGSTTASQSCRLNLPDPRAHHVKAILRRLRATASESFAPAAQP